MNKIIFVLFTCLTCLINPIYVESSSGSNFCQLDNSYALIYTCYYNYDLGAWGSFPAKADYFNDRKSLMPQQVVNLGNSTNKIWRVTNNGSDTYTLYASWSKPSSGNIGDISSTNLPPFKLTYGQRWELKKGEGQNVQVAVDRVIGSQQAILYMWWDERGNFKWDSAYEFHFDGGLVWLPAVTDLLLN